MPPESTAEVTTDASSVIARRDRRIGRITLNRPRALNALDLAMIRDCATTLAEWAADPAVHSVVIDGAGGRAFCAGGDIRAVRAYAMAGDSAAIEAFFAEEFALNLAIARFPKPYVALIDGVCMGGGIGLSVHGAIRVATENGLFAMPETAIGYFPDVGTTYVLPRLPGSIGIYLGLTGARLHGADAVHAGLASHFVPQDRLSSLAEALTADGIAVLAGFSAPLPPFSLAPHRRAIDRCFAAPSVPHIVELLRQDPGSWARGTLEQLGRMSPSALCWSHAIINQGARRTLAECLQAELALTRSVCRHPDFAEGVRAMVVDKDRQPKWSPPLLEQVDQAQIAAMVASTDPRLATHAPDRAQRG